MEPAAGHLGAPVDDGNVSNGANGMSEAARVVHGLGPHAPSRCRSGPVTPIPLGSGAVLIPLAADVRRRARLARRIVLDDEGAIDVETSLLATHDPPTLLLAGAARALAAAGRLHDVVHVVLGDGEAWLDDGSWRYDPAEPQRDVRCLLVTLGEERGRTHVVFVPRGATVELERPCGADARRRRGPRRLGARPRTPRARRLQAPCSRRSPFERTTRWSSARGIRAGSSNPSARAASMWCSTAPRPSPWSGRWTSGCATVASSCARRWRRASARCSTAPTTDPSPAPTDVPSDEGDELEDRDVVVRLLTAVPRVDGLLAPLESGRERRAVELLAYLALRAGEPVTGERLRVRVLGTPSTDAAAKTLFNVASCLRRSLGDGAVRPSPARRGSLGALRRRRRRPLRRGAASTRGPRGPVAARTPRSGWRGCAPPSSSSSPSRSPRSSRATTGSCPRATSRGSRRPARTRRASWSSSRSPHGLVELAGFALERAVLVDPHAERLAVAAARVAAARQASFEAIAPAARSTVPSAPAVA